MEEPQEKSTMLTLFNDSNMLFLIIDNDLYDTIEQVPKEKLTKAVAICEETIQKITLYLAKQTGN
jgi:hypothetical protein